MRQSLLTTSVLGAAGVFVSSWITTSENEPFQFNFVSASCYSSHASAASGFVIQETDDDGNPNLVSDVNSISVSATTETKIYGTVRKQFWRIKYTNGGTQQSLFVLIADATDTPLFAVTNLGEIKVSGSFSGTSDINLKQVNGATISLGQTTASASLPTILASDQVLPLPPVPTTYAPITSAVTKANIKVSAGNIVSIFISNDNSSKRWFQLHNKATAPVATDVPLLSVPIGGTSSPDNPAELAFGTDFFTNKGMAFSLGIGWAISTTQATFTDSATAAEHVVIVNYR